MVCDVCQNMLGHQHGRYAKGTLDIRYDHHKNAQTFQQAVQDNCYICRSLYVSLASHLQANISQSRQNSIPSSSRTINEQNIISSLSQQSFSSKAFLFYEISDRTYRLEIQLELDRVSMQHDFHLETRQGSHGKPDQRSVHVKYRVPAEKAAVPRTLLQPSLHKNFETVHQWLKMCKCYDAAPAAFCPTRLISLENVKALISAYGQYTVYERGAKETVNLVETAEWKNPDLTRANYSTSNMHYVTLSHCWGGEVRPQLLDESLEDFKQGILIGSLPRTFQDAIYFAASLDTVGYIWIDSLCIIQHNEHDWTKESAIMHLVYSNSFLNLSATAALNSHGGFFRDCGFELQQEEEVTLDIEGLPRAYDGQAVSECLHDRSRFFKRQCIVVDASFWKNQVNQGPVNMRGWVLQERLMSPRVVHFCHDQVGWECACRNAPKTTTSCGTHPSTISAGSLKDKSIVEGIKRRLLDAQAPIACSPFDLWAAVVNTYTRTTVSFPRDKLIALSGLAEITSKETKCTYVAGLWQTNLVSQLLWYIEPAFDDRHRIFSNPATFKAEYCAPSWSWAAINATGHGITYAKTAKQRPFVTIDDTHVTTLLDFEFGAVLSARITLRGKLRKASLVSIPNNRFAWHLVDRGHLDAERHQDVYLDCPLRDDDCIDKPGTYVYVLPIAENVQNSGTTTDLHLVCLILRAGEQMGTFKRIGVTKLSPFMDRKACAKVDIDGRGLEYAILKTSSDDTMLPHAGYDERTGAHRLHLV